MMHDGLTIWKCMQHTALCSTSCRFTPICTTSFSSLNVDSFARLFKLILSLHISRRCVRILMHTCWLLLHSPAYLDSILTEMSVALRASYKKQICGSCCIASNKSSRLSSFKVLLSAYALQAHRIVVLQKHSNFKCDKHCYWVLIGSYCFASWSLYAMGA